MMPIDKKTNQNLKLFETGLERNKSDNKSYLEWLTQKLDSLNNQIAETSYLKSHRPDLIGSTELHLAYCKSDLEVFHWLLSHGADYTLKNQNGLTVLHLVLKSENKDRFCRFDWKGRLENSFINAILTAHIKQKHDANPCDPNGLSHFHGACMTNNVEAVEFFLDNGVSIHDGISTNSPYFPGYTPLHFAVRHFSFEVVEVLLKRSTNIFAKDSKGRTPLHLLLERNFEMANISSDLQSPFRQERDLSGKITRVLLDNMTNKDPMMIDDLGLSFLHVVSAMMDLSVVEQVLEKVTDINHCVNVQSLDAWAGYNALHFAAIFNLNILKMLVKRGADLYAKNAKGVTPLDLSLERYKVEDIRSILLQRAEWKDITFSDGKTKLLDLINAMRSLDHLKKFLRRVTKNAVIFLPNNSTLWPGFTPMHLFVLLAKCIDNHYDKQKQEADETNLQMVSDLYDKNTKMIETRDAHGYTPLHLCFRLGKMEKIANSLETLYEKLDNPHDIVDEDSLSLLHIACASNNASLVAKLLLTSNNSNLAYTGESMKGSIVRGWTPLHVAVVQRQTSSAFSFNNEQNTRIVMMLLKYGADVNAKDAHEITPVHLLVVPGYFYRCITNKAMDDILLSKSNLLQVGITGDFGLGHLHVACFRGKEDTVRKLVDGGAVVNGTIKSLPNMYDGFDRYNFSSDSNNYKDTTPLYISLKSHHKNGIVDFLIHRGADIFAKNSKGVPLLCDALETHLEYEESNIHNLKVLVKTLAENEDLQIRAEREIGLTMLHIACRTNERGIIKKLLDSGADVNAKVRSDSPIWPGDTPLHIFLRYVDKYKVDEDADYTLRLLLDKKADVTVQNAKQQTPVYLAFKDYICRMYRPGKNESTFGRPMTLLRAQRDFSINPTSVEGMTHFHIACSLADVFTVERFLKHGHVIVDQPIDFFAIFGNPWKEFPASGCTPMHLAVMSRSTSWGCAKNSPESTPLETVDLLVKHGADVDAENAQGETPFRIAACEDLREKLARSGANVNAKDALGHTPMEDALSKRPKSPETIKKLLRYGCHFNAFDSEMEIGYIALTARSMPLKEMQQLMSTAITTFSNLLNDEMDRTVIHNLVSIYQLNISSNYYAAMIDHMTRTGCDVDAQDKLGRTALHFAVKFKNLSAISGLLLVGADISITDVRGQTAFAQEFQLCTRCSLPTDAEDEQCQHYKVFRLLALQVKKLQLCGLDVHPMNEEIVATAFQSFGQIDVNDQFRRELEKIKNIQIRSYPVTLYNFMSELDVVSDYPTMSDMKKNIINLIFFSYKQCRQLREKYSEIAGLLKLQYRKAVKRTVLLEKAKISLDVLAGIRVPELCSHIILRFLKNSELQRTITATEYNQ